MPPPRVTLDQQLVARIDSTPLPGLAGASRNVRTRFLVEWALVHFEKEAKRRAQTAATTPKEVAG